jgi:hypothetical protein
MPSTDDRDPEVIIPRHQVNELNVNYYAHGVSDSWLVPPELVYDTTMSHSG